MRRALRIEHETSYTYPEGLSHAVLQVRLSPKNSEGQQIENWQCEIEGGKKEFAFTDHNGNLVFLVTSSPDTTEIKVICMGSVKIFDQNGIAGYAKCLAPEWLYKNQTSLTELGNLTDKFTAECTGQPGNVSWLHDLSGAIRRQIEYKLAATEANSSAVNAVRKGLGVCQDHAHVFIGCCRSIGIPSRYVSGYLFLDQNVEQTAMHAWAEAFIPSLGWVGFDVSNGVAPDSKYLRIAQGRDYSDVAPIKGTVLGGLYEVMSVKLIVQQQ